LAEPLLLRGQLHCLLIQAKPSSAAGMHINTVSTEKMIEVDKACVSSCILGAIHMLINSSKKPRGKTIGW